MCGFFAHLGKRDRSSLEKFASKIQYRGPDNTQHKVIREDLFFGFHRLAIMDTSEAGDQPIYHPDDNSLSLICNGEIYNHRALIAKNQFTVKSSSDCEVILHLYKKYGIEITVSMLDGVFAFALYDASLGVLFSARDLYGVRPSFIGFVGKEVCLSSESKTMIDFCDSITQFPPGTWWRSDQPSIFTSFNTVFFRSTSKFADEATACRDINSLLTTAVSKRMMSEREIGCLLSGGLDSSLIAALAAREMSQSKMKTFSIGLTGSPDLRYAKLVSEHIGSEHHSIEMTSQEFLDVIPEVIYNIESFDTTTVRASVGNYLVSKFIRENTDCKVIFNGDGADEVCMGYIYNQNAPSTQEFYEENLRLLSEIHFYDVLRSDRSISSNGLEARTPFLDKQFVSNYMSIPPEMKMFGKAVGRPEKFLLRKAFENTGLLPDEILWRNKCAFSDGVSSQENSWHTIIKSHVDKLISDDEFNEAKNKFSHCPPALKESYYYRKIFEETFKGYEYLIPHFWMPRWTDVIDPSAREIQGYQE